MGNQFTLKKWGISGSTLKLIAITAMLTDHIGATLVSAYLTTPGNWSEGGYAIYYVMRMVIGRVAFPIFAFLLTQGFEKTSNVWKYAFRLGLFALVSEIPFDLAFSGVAWDPESQNVFLTLFLGLVSLIIMQKISERGWNRMCSGFLGAVGVILCMAAAELLDTDYGAYGILCMVVLYLTRRNRWLQVMAGTMSLWFGDAAMEIVKQVLLYVQIGFGEGSLAGLSALLDPEVLGQNVTFAMGSTETLAPLGLILVPFYNGERGLKLKYVFYLFYPLHLLVLYFLTEALL